MAKEYLDLITALDIGSSKIMVAIAEALPEGELRLAGIGTTSSSGLSRGVVVNIDATMNDIQQALSEAEQSAGCKVHRACASITGDHIRGKYTQGNQTLDGREATELDMERLMANAQDGHSRVLWLEPQEIFMDDNPLKEPVGMRGSRLDVTAYLLLGGDGALENIQKCARHCGLQIDRFIPSAYASSRAVLTQDERELGALVLDIGADTMDIALFYGGVMRHMEVWPWAGDRITRDIAAGLEIPLKDAEALKINHGCAKELLAHPLEQVQVQALGERGLKSIGLQTLARAMESRLREFLKLAEEVVSEAGYPKKLGGGVVLTGGTAVTPGILQLASDVLPWSVRCGMPRFPEGLADIPTLAQPGAATMMGLLEEERLIRLRGFRTKHSPRSASSWLSRSIGFIRRNF